MRWPSLFLAIICMAGPAMGAQGDETPWPVVRETDVSMIFDYNSERYDLVVPIYATGGEELYRLICNGGWDRHLDNLSNKGIVNYVGPLTCVLNEQGQFGTETSLLSEGALYSAPWQTRGSFSPAVFHVKACAEHPTYGRLRRFRLRGVELTLQITEPEPELDDEELDDYTLRVTVKRDPTAKTRFAEPSGYLYPERFGAKCEKVEKGIEETVDPDVLLSAPEKFVGLQAGVIGFLQAGVPMKLYQGTDLAEAPPSRENRNFLVIEDKDGTIQGSVCINMQVYMEGTFVKADRDRYGLSDIRKIVLRNNRTCWVPS